MTISKAHPRSKALNRDETCFYIDLYKCFIITGIIYNSIKIMKVAKQSRTNLLFHLLYNVDIFIFNWCIYSKYQNYFNPISIYLSLKSHFKKSQIKRGRLKECQFFYRAKTSQIIQQMIDILTSKETCIILVSDFIIKL